MDEGVAYVASVNNRPKVWTIYFPDFQWAHCSFPIAKEGMICKHIVKVFKMLHPHVVEGIIVREVGTKHSVDRATPMSQSFTDLSQRYGHMRTALDVATTTNVDDIENDTNHTELGYTKQRTCSLAPTIPVSQDKHCAFSTVSLGEASNPQMSSQDCSSQAAIATSSNDIYKSLAKKVA
jgi:hypothetical protein